VTPDTTQLDPKPQPEARSTAGMTTKVVKGSLWTLAGQVAPLGVSLFTTPFVIRLLGSEGYGVLILVGLIPTYFAFADFGMGIASTKFASEAYAAGDSEKEARTVRTAALIAVIVSLPIAAAIFIFSNAAISAFNVPPELHTEANLALKLASITFVIGFLNNIFNTPQLTRLRMDLNTFVNSGFRMLGLIATPIVIYLGGGILGAVAILLIVALLTLAAHLYVSGKLLNQLFQFTLDRNLIRPMLNFGGALVIAGIAGIFLVNTEKGFLSAIISPQALAYYYVAFMFANMMTMFSGAMVQSLLPAFSQLQSDKNREHLLSLYSRGIKMNLLWLVPTVYILTIIAKPFFTMWAGEDFGRESVTPFYIILSGIVVNIVAYFPHTAIIASGRTDVLAKLYWIELPFYILIVWYLTTHFGILGTAAAWSLRVIVDAFLMFFLVKRIVHLSFHFNNSIYFLTAIIIMIGGLAISILVSFNFFVVFPLTIVTFSIYLLITYRWLIDNNEMNWFINILKNRLAK